MEHLTIPFSSLELFADPSVDFAISFNQVSSLSNSKTEIKPEKGEENADKKKNKLNKKTENVIDLKNFKK